MSEFCRELCGLHHYTAQLIVFFLFWFTLHFDGCQVKLSLLVAFLMDSQICIALKGTQSTDWPKENCLLALLLLEVIVHPLRDQGHTANSQILKTWPCIVSNARACIHKLLYMVAMVHDMLGGWLSSRVASVLDSGTEGPGFKSHSWHHRLTVVGRLFTPIVPLFTKQRSW